MGFNSGFKGLTLCGAVVDVHYEKCTNPINTFDIHVSVYRNIITNYSQQDATFLEFIYFYKRPTSLGDSSPLCSMYTSKE